MKVIDILKEYRRNGDLEFLEKNGLLDDETKRKVEVLERLFEESNLTSYRLESIKIVRMYYKEITSANTIAKIIHVSERHVYRMRDACVQWLSEMLDKDPSPIE